MSEPLHVEVPRLGEAVGDDQRIGRPERPSTGRRRASRCSARPESGITVTIRLPLRLRPPGDLQRGPHRRARGDAGRDPLASGERARRVDRVIVGDRDDLVDHVPVQDRRHEPGADPLDPVRPRRPAREHRRGGRLDRDDPHLGIALLQDLAHARDRAARADRRHEHVHAAVQVRPDLLRRRAPVHLRVGRVLELLRNERVRRLARDAASPRRPPRACRPSTR